MALVVEAGMARMITVALEDDLDGGPAVETVRFSVGGALRARRRRTRG